MDWIEPKESRSGLVFGISIHLKWALWNNVSPSLWTALLMFLGVVIYPSGWDHPVVRSVCGNDAVKYYPGGCGIRWAYILAILGLFDAIVLSALAFVLGTRYIRLSETMINSSSRAPSVYKGQFVPNSIGSQVLWLITKQNEKHRSVIEKSDKYRRGYI